MVAVRLARRCFSSGWFQWVVLASLVLTLVWAQSNAAESTAAPASPQPPGAITDEVKAAALEKDVTQGALRIIQPDGTVVECPLKHTDVQAEIAGFLARVKVTQSFANPTKEKIEAVYVFPLPHEAAVDQMTMVVGDRRVVGLIKRREEARQIYAQAVAAGQTAALLEQERPNIFTQSVGNIEPGQEVKIEIAYADVLRYDVGTYEFQFPMVVGPRYMPGAPISTPAPIPAELEGKVSPPVADTTRVPDASRISPPVLRPEVRNGHEISLAVKLDAGVPIQSLAVANHRAEIQREGDRRATIKLSPNDSVANKDFVLRYDVTGKKPELAVLAHTAQHKDAKRLGNGYFLLMIQPQEDERLTKSPPREIVFLVDVSGSMSGEPTAKVIDAMSNMLKLCREQDTVQVITFASSAHKLFDKPVPVNEANIAQALNFTAALRGSGGTEMLRGVQMAIDEPIDQKRMRIVVMLTDGYIGNEAEIIEHVGKNCRDQIRFWCIGIGSSPNMFLVDGVAKQGGGMGKQLGLQDDAAGLTQEVMTRIQRAQLANIQIDWGGLQVSETYPARIPELWAGRPVIVLGRYTDGGKGKITVRGTVEGESVSWPLSIELPRENADHDALAKAWARRKIEGLMQQAFYASDPAIEEEVTAIALDYSLMSQYTSLVAVEERDASPPTTTATPPRRMLVPVPLPEGTRWEGFFGRDAEQPADFGLDSAAPVLGVRLQESLSSRTPMTRKAQLSLGLPAQPINHGVAGGLHPTPAAGANVHQLSRGRGLVSAKQNFGIRAGGTRGSYRGLRESRAEDRFYFRSAGVAGGPAMLPGLQEGAAVYSYALADVVPQVEPTSQAAEQALKAGAEASKQKHWDTARAHLERAYFLDRAAATFGQSDGHVAEAALDALQSVRDRQVQSWTSNSPALRQRLSLVLRDRSIEEALQEVATAAGLDVRLLPGSLEDAETMLASGRARVSFLDLRGATMARALDWILLPSRLTWRVVGEEVVAGSPRRMEGSAAWVYDVSVLILPDADELAKAGDQQKALAESKKALNDFLQVVRKQLKADDLAVTWYRPGQVLVWGDKALHDAAGKLFTDLASPDRKLNGPAAELYPATSARVAARKEAVEKRRKSAELVSIAHVHEEFGWQLLAEAAAGSLDLEALTELQIAWKSEATADMLRGKEAAIPLRSWWVLTEAARELPDEHSELQSLVKLATQLCKESATDALTELEKTPDDAGIFVRALFATLANRSDKEFVAKSLPLLTRDRAGNTPLAVAATLAKSLLAPIDADVRTGLQSLAQLDVQGNELIVLYALASRRAGSEAWSAFRAEAASVLGNQPLSGNVIVLLSRLDVR